MKWAIHLLTFHILGLYCNNFIICCEQQNIYTYSRDLGKGKISLNDILDEENRLDDTEKLNKPEPETNVKNDNRKKHPVSKTTVDSLRNLKQPKTKARHILVLDPRDNKVKLRKINIDSDRQKNTQIINIMKPDQARKIKNSDIQPLTQYDNNDSTKDKITPKDEKLIEQYFFDNDEGKDLIKSSVNYNLGIKTELMNKLITKPLIRSAPITQNKLLKMKKMRDHVTPYHTGIIDQEKLDYQILSDTTDVDSVCAAPTESENKNEDLSKIADSLHKSKFDTNDDESVLNNSVIEEMHELIYPPTNINYDSIEYPDTSTYPNNLQERDFVNVETLYNEANNIWYPPNNEFYRNGIYLTPQMNTFSPNLEYNQDNNVITFQKTIDNGEIDLTRFAIPMQKIYQLPLFNRKEIKFGRPNEYEYYQNFNRNGVIDRTWRIWKKTQTIK